MYFKLHSRFLFHKTTELNKIFTKLNNETTTTSAARKKYYNTIVQYFHWQEVQKKLL